MGEPKQDLQAHDALVKGLLGSPQAAAGVLRSILPAALVAATDFSTLAREAGSFVDEHLRQFHTDLLFSVRLREGRSALLYVLFEHQSRAEEGMAWRLLRYLVRILDAWTREHPSLVRLPAVVPVVLYHGATAWTAPTDLVELFDLPDDLRAAVRDHLPTFRFLLEDLSIRTDEELRGGAFSAVQKLVLLSLKHGRHTQDPLAFFASVASLLRDVRRAPSGLSALEQVLRYHLCVNDRVDPRALGQLLAAEVDEEAREVVMTAAERLMAEGEARGLLKGEARLLLRMIRLRFGAPPAEVVARIEAASLADLERWGERLLDATTLDDVFQD